MSEDGEPGVSAGPVTAVRRQLRAAGRVRSHRHEVKVTEEQEARLVELAGARGITVARLLVESALAGGAGAAAVQAELVAEVLRLGRALGKVGVNVNQIARLTNATGEYQDHTVAVLAELARVCARVDAVCGALDLTGPGTGRGSGQKVAGA